MCSLWGICVFPLQEFLLLQQQERISDVEPQWLAWIIVAAGKNGSGTCKYQSLVCSPTYPYASHSNSHMPLPSFLPSKFTDRQICLLLVLPNYFLISSSHHHPISQKSSFFPTNMKYNRGRRILSIFYWIKVYGLSLYPINSSFCGTTSSRLQSTKQ